MIETAAGRLKSDGRSSSGLVELLIANGYDSEGGLYVERYFSNQDTAEGAVLRDPSAVLIGDTFSLLASGGWLVVPSSKFTFLSSDKSGSDTFITCGDLDFNCLCRKNFSNQDDDGPDDDGPTFVWTETVACLSLDLLPFFKAALTEVLIPLLIDSVDKLVTPVEALDFVFVFVFVFVVARVQESINKDFRFPTVLTLLQRINISIPLCRIIIIIFFLLLLDFTSCGL